jgi:threonine/homoserine/homoserine lactone efflux protein
VHAVAAALGLAALLATSALAFDVVKWSGAAYLLWLALQMARSATTSTTADAPQSGPATTTSFQRIYWQGLLTNVLNPKVALFFLALLPQFIRADAADKPVAFLFLGAVFIANGTVFLFALVAVTNQLRRVGTSGHMRRVLNALGATLYVGLAARLALAQR